MLLYVLLQVIASTALVLGTDIISGHQQYAAVWRTSK